MSKLRRSAGDVKAMLDAIEAARTQLSAAGDATILAVDEFRAQHTVIKERVQWLLSELDKLDAIILKSTHPGDSE